MADRERRQRVDYEQRRRERQGCGASIRPTSGDKDFRRRRRCVYMSNLPY